MQNAKQGQGHKGFTGVKEAAGLRQDEGRAGREGHLCQRVARITQNR